MVELGNIVLMVQMQSCLLHKGLQAHEGHDLSQESLLERVPHTEALLTCVNQNLELALLQALSQR